MFLKNDLWNNIQVLMDLEVITGERDRSVT